MEQQTMLEQQEQQVLNLLKEVIDPELGINIIDLGLVYTIEAREENIAVEMTLTTKGCPMGGAIMEEVNQKLTNAFPHKQMAVTLVWDPLWSPDQITEEGMRMLGW